ncbi:MULTISPECIES: sensor histidine kinase [Sporosarcina]|uniref:sensor histidine kinase n=1 Tax=Sporosarcina TaxID=1569 RepID=UPI000590A887|nr:MULTISPECIES: sensor histidine kinase [Sporosarcina]WJY26242.1 sensor histidine kinase [Sporosarcina sp. 0.2-SM1T-5]
MKPIELFPKRFGLIPYVFLAYLTLPVITVLNETGWKRGAGIVCLLVFLAAYRKAYWTETDRGHLVWSAVQLAVILLLSVSYQPYNLLLAFYVSNFIGWIRDDRLFRIGITGFGAVLAVITFYFFSEYGASANLTMLPFVVVMALTPIAVRGNMLRGQLEEQLDEANERIRQLSRQEERVRIARDLHDTLGHTLSLITLKSQVIQRVKQDPERVSAEAAGIEETSRAALTQVRELVTDMRGGTIGSELAAMEELLGAAGIRLEIEQEAGLPDLPPLKQNILAMCLREAATNIVRHSGADACTVSMAQDERGIAVRIIDNGIGMDGAQWGNGLAGMRERLALIEGTMAVTDCGGMQFALHVPLPVTAEGMGTV